MELSGCMYVCVRGIEERVLNLLDCWLAIFKHSKNDAAKVVIGISLEQGDFSRHGKMGLMALIRL